MGRAWSQAMYIIPGMLHVQTNHMTFNSLSKRGGGSTGTCIT